MKEMSLEERLRLKRRLEKVLSEILSNKYDCNIRIKFKPEPEKIEAQENQAE